MIAKKTDKGNLENKRGLFLLVGFVVVLALVYAGFELFANEDTLALQRKILAVYRADMNEKLNRKNLFLAGNGI